jgi:hypothetical protein
LAVRPSAAEVLLDAIREQHSNETFEKALSRVVRRQGGTYADYIALVGRVRERAARDGRGLVSAAKALAGEDE